MPTKQGVITALDIAQRDGFDTHLAWIMQKARRLFAKNMLPAKCTGDISGDPVEAFISFGRWSAKCPNCGGTEYVDPDEGIFFCLNCANGDNDRNMRPVDFPNSRSTLEKEIMKRPIRPPKGLGPIETQFNGVPLIFVEEGGLSRSWPLDRDNPIRETLQEIKDLNRSVGID